MHKINLTPLGVSFVGPSKYTPYVGSCCIESKHTKHHPCGEFSVNRNQTNNTHGLDNANNK